MHAPRILELGTSRPEFNFPTHHWDWFPNAKEWPGSDVSAVIDVDVLADVHQLSNVFGGVEGKDIIVFSSTIEHFKYPFLAVHEILRTLSIGGLLFM